MEHPRLPYTFEPSLETERLLLRPLTEGDVDDVHAYQSDPDVARYVPYEPRTREEVAAKLAEWSGAVTLAAEGDFWQLGVEKREERGRVIGDVYFTIRSLEHATAAIGWSLHPAEGGRGYMTEAATAVLGVAFTRIGLHRVIADLDPRNLSSAALCRRLGMRLEAHHVEDIWFKGGWTDTAIYAMLAREWRGRC